MTAPFTLREDIEETLRANGESWLDVLVCDLTGEEMSKTRTTRNDLPWYHLWSQKWVYFPHVDDGWTYGTMSVPRNPVTDG